MFLEDENYSPRCECPVEWQGKVLLIRVHCVPWLLKEYTVDPPKFSVALWNLKVLEPEGNYGGGGIFVGVAPFTIISTNLGGSVVVVLLHYDLDLLMITGARNGDGAYDHTGYFVCAVMGSSRRNPVLR